MKAVVSRLLRDAAPAVAFGYAAIAFLMSTMVWSGGDADGDNPASDVANGQAIEFETAQQRLSESTDAFAARPLFHVSREPYRAPEAPAPVIERVTLQLIGIINDGPVRLALVKLSNSDAVFRVTAGQTVRDWTITDITVDGIEVREQGGGTSTLSLDAAN